MKQAETLAISANYQPPAPTALNRRKKIISPVVCWRHSPSHDILTCASIVNKNTTTPTEMKELLWKNTNGKEARFQRYSRSQASFSRYHDDDSWAQRTWSVLHKSVICNHIIIDLYGQNILLRLICMGQPCVEPTIETSPGWSFTSDSRLPSEPPSSHQSFVGTGILRPAGV